MTEIKFPTHSVKILDCTLRDGSYLIDYQFTAEDTYIVCVGLERAGFKLIEIGHGTGLHSSLTSKEKAAATDEEYLQAASAAMRGSDAQFGMFFIPGIGTMEDLEMAVEYGMRFVRIGTNVTEIDQAKPYIEKAKALGMTVSSNLMKSYAVSIDDFIKLAKKADEYGSDIICVVDSAGGMFPEDVGNYILRLREITDKEIGFHGHNNLQLAIANSIEAVKAGASIIDSSLQGMGRSAGNAQTEILLMALEKLGYKTGIDAYRAMDLGERLIKPMMYKEQGVNDLDIVAGIAQFHSSFLDIIHRTSKKFEVDPRMLIMKVSEINRIHVTQDIAEEAASEINERMQRKDVGRSIIIDSSFLIKHKDKTLKEQLQSITDEIISLSKKSGQISVFSLTLSNSEGNTFPFIRKSPSMIIGNAEIINITELKEAILFLDGLMDWILLDESCPEVLNSELNKFIKKSFFAWYSEDRILRVSIASMLSQKRPQKKVLILADPESTMIMKLSLKTHGMLVVFPDKNNSPKQQGLEIMGFLNEIDAIVSFGKEYAACLESVNPECLQSDGMFIYAAKPDAFPKSFIEKLISRNMPVYRVDTRAGLAAELDLAIETTKLIGTIGQDVIEGISVVSGGLIAPSGYIIVDSVINPSKVIGITDGSGGVLPKHDEGLYKDAVEKVKNYIIKKYY